MFYNPDDLHIKDVADISYSGEYLHSLLDRASFVFYVVVHGSNSATF